jgi:serine phosphatase RsbU (regulator of sigma subunit)
VKLEKGDVLVCSTDGIINVADEHKKKFGEARLAELIRSNRSRSAYEIVDAVLSEVAACSSASMNDDDKVLIVMKVTAEKGQETSQEREHANAAG